MLLEDELAKRILILDGAMGTMIQRKAIGNNESFNLTRPEIILDIHRQYIAAGADIIETNSFGASRIGQAEYGAQEQAAQMALQSAVLARRAADEAGRRVWVAGSVGPGGKSLSLSPDLGDPSHRDVDFDTLFQVYSEQIGALAKGGVDLILLETCFDALNAKAALLAAAETAPQLPVMVSVSVGDRSGRTLTGQTLEAFYRSVEHGNLISFGMNCSLGAADMAPLLSDVAAFSHHHVSCHPNAGLPNEMGLYTQTAAEMASEMEAMAQKGLLNIAGGCCGTTPEHIAAIAQAMRGKAPHRLNPKPESLTVSGLEAVSIDTGRNNFTNVGERTNVAGSRKFAKLIAAGEYDTALKIAADQIEGGASVIDVNMDDAMLDSTFQMRTFLRYISNDPAVAKAALMIDSSRWETVLEGLKNAQGKCIVNSISLKEGEEAFLHKARTISRMGAAMVVMAFDEEGQATDYERKIAICKRAYELLTVKAAVPPTDIIFDVNVLSVGTGIAEHARFGVDFIEAVRWIKTNLPGALTSGGISNLSFAFRGNNPVREAMHSVFLYHAGKAGLDMGIVNPGMLRIYDDIEPELLELVEDVVLNRREDATQRLVEKAQAMLAAAVPQSGQQVSAPEEESGPVDSRLVTALVKGSSQHLREDVLESLSEHGGSPVDVIEGPLMDGMARVGELFGSGKMFLPQVVKSAKLMRDAVAVLQPFMDGVQDSRSNRPRVVIATVKGDVHDIGKNITATVLRCNGFDVTDLGVMVPLEEILRSAAEQHADIIAVSGLITPSLFQMEEICREMAARGMDTPLLVGGATTSALHTAVKLAPLYPHVFHGTDASSSAVMAKRLMSSRVEFENAEHGKQEKLRALHEKGAGSADTGSSGQKCFAPDSYLPAGTLKSLPAGELPLAQALPHFDWKTFFAVWGMKTEDASLRADAEKLLDEGGFRIMLALHFEDCVRRGNDLILSTGRTLPMMRQESGARLSLADFVTEEGGSSAGQAGFMAISVSGRKPGLREALKTHPGGCTCPQCAGTDYDSMLMHSVKVTLAEAASCWVDAYIGQQLDAAGISGMKTVKPAAGYASCPDHSLKKDIMEIIPDSDRLGISFTESYAMIPEASICAMVFAHPQACYPEIRKLSEEALSRYSAKRGFSPEQERQFLNHLK